MDPLVILSKTEQEYLLRIIESSVHLRDAGQLFLWSQGQLQALLPHQLLVCMQFSADGALQQIESLHGGVMDEATSARLCDPEGGLAPRLARHCAAYDAMPCMADSADPGVSLLPFHRELAGCGYHNVLLHGTGALAGGGTVFALFGMPMTPGPRHAWFLALLLPHLHLALVRLARPAPPGSGQPASRAGARQLSTREAEIVGWLREGKRNDEIGDLLGISSLTVKNHLQRIYKRLGVRNRVEAVARCAAMRLPAPASDAAGPGFRQHA